MIEVSEQAPSIESVVMPDEVRDSFKSMQRMNGGNIHPGVLVLRGMHEMHVEAVQALLNRGAAVHRTREWDDEIETVSVTRVRDGQNVAWIGFTTLSHLAEPDRIAEICAGAVEHTNMVLEALPWDIRLPELARVD